jgi:hypothetical protein
MKPGESKKGGASFDMLVDIEKTIKKLEKEMTEVREGLVSHKETSRDRNKTFEKGLIDFNLSIGNMKT